MPEIMNVTNPIPGYENAAGTRSIPNAANDPNIQNIPLPGRVSRPDSKENQQTGNNPQQDQSGPVRYDSNFQAFLQRMLGGGGGVNVEFLRYLAAGSKTVVSSGIQSGTAAELSQALELLQMSEGQFLRFLMDQFSSGTRFNGPLFAALRGAYHATDSPAMRGDILQFVKQYSDYASTPHVEDNLLRSLNRIAAAMPRSWGGKVTEFIALLQNGIQSAGRAGTGDPAGDRAGNLKLLQGRVIPYLSEYVARSHDMGKMRGALTVLTLDIARYESGSQAGMLQAFHQLLNYPSLREKLGGLDDRALLELLSATPFEKAAGNDAFADKLADAANRALRGSAGPEAQEAFKALVSSLLVNESVYMPVNHFLIPLVWNGRAMFSELWVDPDADRDDDQPAWKDDGRHTLRFLFKADIQGLGLFDIVLDCRENQVDLAVRCPETVAPFSGAIQRALTGILADNGLDAGTIHVEKMDKPLTVSEIFPKIFEGRDSINVSV